MSNYGRATIRAVKLYTTGLAESPQDAWAKATAAIFGQGTSGQAKGCPRSAFLGLCEEGLVRGIPSGNYTRSQKNKRYAVDAAAILRRNPVIAIDSSRLWDEVMGGEPKQHNSQMDVVVALWNEGLLIETVG